MARVLRNKWSNCQTTLAIYFSSIIGLLIINKYLDRANSEDYREITDFSEANNETGFPYYVVPNIVHLVHFTDNTDASDKVELSFIEVVTIRAAYRNQKPEKIMIHCNCYEFHGEHWNMVKDLKGLEVNYIERPRTIFGNKLNSVYNASDIARILLLMKYGGIFIDSDTYIVKSLDKYRKFEMSLCWDLGSDLNTRAILANRHARFLKLWYNSYHNYRPKKWYYNTEILPTSSILSVKPQLVHRVSSRNFGVALSDILYARNSDEWKTYDTIRILSLHPGFVKNDSVPEFNLDNIKLYNRSFGQMARVVLYGTTQIIGE